MQTHSVVIPSLVDPALPDVLHVDDEACPAPTVHVIDDDESFRRGMLRILHALGHEAVGYGCAGEFLLTVQGELAGCILLDINMPGPSGIDLLRGLVQRGSVAPIIFVTARDDVMTSVNAMSEPPFDRRDDVVIYDLERCAFVARWPSEVPAYDVCRAPHALDELIARSPSFRQDVERQAAPRLRAGVASAEPS